MPISREAAGASSCGLSSIHTNGGARAGQLIRTTLPIHETKTNEMNFKPENILRRILTCLLLMAAANVGAKEAVLQWERFEQTFSLHTEKNPFTDVDLRAVFIHEGTPDTIRVEGFYDGNDTFRIRFMPTKTGRWTFRTFSSEPEMNGQEGWLVCAPALNGSHGMMKTGPDQSFAYADGTAYYPVGTTSYAWIHADDARQEQTCQSLAESGFNKLRFCIFPNNSVRELPRLYPFVLKSGRKSADGQRTVYTWDFSHFNPAFFQHLEQCIDRLKAIGVEADLILFTPYDDGLWGFDRMTMENNRRYLRYVVARLSAFSNVWWSMANEWDLCRAKTHDQWIEMSEYVHRLDPYHHLLSIHGGTATYIDYNRPCFTHASIQDQGPLYNFEGAVTVRNIIHKPVIFDEVCYEGDHESRWAQLSGQEMLQRIWTGLIAGTYVTHGECFCTGSDFYTGYAFLATGGRFRGTSPARIRFTRKILESLPNSLRLADQSWDPVTASAGPGTYLIYFGNEKPKSWAFSLPAKNSHWPRLKGGERFRMEIIDTWNMTVTPLKEVFEVKSAPAKRMTEKSGKHVKLPGKPYLLLRIQQI